MSWYLLAMVCLAPLLTEGKSEVKNEQGLVTFEIVGLLAEKKPMSMLLTLDPDAEFRGINSAIITDRQLKNMLAQRHKAKPDEPIYLILHLPNEKGVSFEELGDGLRRIRAASASKQRIIVYVHSSVLTNRK